LLALHILLTPEPGRWGIGSNALLFENATIRAAPLGLAERIYRGALWPRGVIKRGNMPSLVF
jgi:hypothetical protein